MSKNKKKKSKKTIYYDDGRSIADMSAIGGKSQKSSYRFGFKEKMRTYFESVKLMILPMLLTIGIIGVAFLILYILLSLA